MTLMTFQYGEKELVTLMNHVLDAPSKECGDRLAALREAMIPYITSLDIGRAAPETARFVASAQTYLRALSTYPVASDEWLDVFRAFRQLFNAYHSPSAPPVRLAEPAMTYMPNSGTWRS